jgi:hypothetical protein
MQRYHLERSDQATDKTIIVDFGGPGIAALAGEDRLGAFRSVFSQVKPFNLLLLEEPWVTAPVSDSCRAAMTAFYHSVRMSKDVGSSGAAIHSSCNLAGGKWGFTPASYRQAIDAVVRREGLKLHGFMGHSWGGVRLSYLQDTQLALVALIRPYPIGAPVNQLLDARVEKITKGDVVPMLELPQVVGARSLPVSPFDLASAKVAFGYVEDASLAEYKQLFVTQGPETVGQLSDSLWGRYGVDSLALGLLGELEEICNVTGGLAGEDYPSTNTVRGVLTARFAPCAGLGRGGQGGVTFRSIAADSMCVVTSRNDSITPDHLIQKYLPSNARTSWIQVEAKSHSSFDGLAECLSSKER